MMNGWDRHPALTHSAFEIVILRLRSSTTGSEWVSLGHASVRTHADLTCIDLQHFHREKGWSFGVDRMMAGIVSRSRPWIPGRRGKWS